MTRAARIVSLAVVIGLVLAGTGVVGYAHLANAQSTSPSDVEATQTSAAAAVRTIEAALASTPTGQPTETPTPSPTPRATQVAPGQALMLSPTNESQHPYANGADESWLISNLDARAQATSLHFSRLELEEGVDWLIIMDAQDVEIQRLTGAYPDGVWTDVVPGNLVKVRLLCDSSVQGWGFAADAVASVPYVSLAYSPHPYPNNADLKWPFNNLDVNATGTRLHFSRIDLEENVDWLVIMDINETPYQWITGHHADGLWTIGVPGTGVIVRLISDSSVNDWGFNLDQLESAAPAEELPRAEQQKTLAESKHPYEPGTQQTWSLTNPDPAAAFTKVHFMRLGLSDDALVISDGNGNRVQTFGGGTQGRDFWSEDVPGRVLKVQLLSDGSKEDWGFRIDGVASGVTQPGLAESKHPYEPGTRQSWSLVNPNPAAAFTKVHFRRLGLGDDILILSDGNGNRVQTFGGDTQGQDFWSDDVPGRVVKVELVSDSSNEGWGLRIDGVVSGVTQPSLAESKHPYESGTRQTWSLVNPNPAAAFTKVHFMRLGLGDDPLILSDGNGNRVQTFEGGTQGQDFWSEDVPGRVVKVELVSDSSNEGWGFRIDDVAPKAEETPVPAFVSAVYVHVGQPGTLMLNDVPLGKVAAAGDYLIQLPGIGEHDDHGRVALPAPDDRRQH